MIPSHPLRLGEIIQESFRIIGRTFTRASMVTLVAIVPMMFLVSASVDSFIHAGAEVAVSAGITDESLTKVVGAFHVSINSTYGAQDAAVRDYFMNDSMLVARYGAPSNGKVGETIVWYLSKVTDGKLHDAVGARLILRMIFSMLVPFLLFVVCGFILSSLISALTLDLDCQAFEEQAISLKTNWSTIVRKQAWMLLLMEVLIYIVTSAPRIIINLSGNSSSGFVILFGAITALVQIFFSIRWYVAPPALISEGLTPFDALRRSWHLTDGYWWRTFGIMIVIALIFAPLAVIFGVGFLIVFFATSFESMKSAFTTPIITIAGIEHALSGIGAWIAVGAGVIIYFSIVFGLPFKTTMYYDLRTRLDGPLDYPETEEEAGVHPTLISSW